MTTSLRDPMVLLAFLMPGFLSPGIALALADNQTGGEVGGRSSNQSSDSTGARSGNRTGVHAGNQTVNPPNGGNATSQNSSHSSVSGGAPLVARSTCLKNARFQPHQRTNASLGGVSQPLKITPASWDTSKLESRLFQIITEEMFGIETESVGTCSSSELCLLWVAGCARPEDMGTSTNSGCDTRGPPLTHINIGSWENLAKFKPKLAWLRRNYPDKEPLFLGSIGYAGNEGVYGPEAARAAAIQQEHLALSYYITYSHPRIRLSQFFDSPWDIDTGELRPCNETQMASDRDMRAYLRATNDTQGLTVTHDGNVTRYVGMCSDGLWWMSPVCRDHPTMCIPFVTGGVGWLLAEVMQRAAIWKMPLAIAVAKSWGNYLAIPKKHKVLNEWWFPDKSFFSINAFQVVFPDHNNQEFQDMLYKTADPTVDITKWAYRPLQEDRSSTGFQGPLDTLRLMTLTREQISELLEILIAVSDDHEAAACQWLLRHPEMVTAWMPLRTACRRGQGLTKDGTFVDLRDKADECLWCSAGRMSVRLRDDKGETYQCVQCSEGKFQASPGATECEDCARGEHAASPGLVACTRCSSGRYAEKVRQRECTACLPGFQTKFLGAVGPEDCVCDEGSYRDGAVRTSCLPCKAGMLCRAGSDALDYSKAGAAHIAVVPLLREGFWSSAEQPLDVFRCQSTPRCRGLRVPGRACPLSLDSRACSQCEQGRHWSGKECVDCGPGATSFFIFPILPLMLSPLLICLLYLLSRDPYSRWGSWRNGFAALVFIVLNQYHIINVIGSTNVPLSEPSRATLRNFEFMSNGLALFSPQCSGIPGFKQELVLQTCLPAVGIALYALVWGSSRVLGRWRQKLSMDLDLVVSACLSLMFTFFTGIASTAFIIFKCDDNPNGKLTLREDRGYLCYDTDWWGMVAIGIIATLLWVVGTAVVFAWAILRAPRNFHHEAVQRRWKFLFMKYRSDVHWWGLVVLIKGILLPFGSVVFISGTMQLYWIAALLIVYAMLTLCFRPWRHMINTIVDGWLHLSLLVLCLAVAGHSALEEDASKQQRQSMGDIVFNIVVYGVLLPPLIAGAQMMYWQTAVRARRKKEVSMELVMDSVLLLAEVGDDACQDFLSSLSEWDLECTLHFQALIQTEFAGRMARWGCSARKQTHTSLEDIRAERNWRSQSFSRTSTGSGVSAGGLSSDSRRQRFSRFSRSTRQSCSTESSPEGNTIVDLSHVESARI